MQDLDFTTHKTYLSDIERKAARSTTRPVRPGRLWAGANPVILATGVLAMISVATYAFVG